MVKFEKIKVPEGGSKIEIINGELKIPDNPIIPFIEGDGIGPDIMKAARRVIDAAIQKAYGGKRKIIWFEIMAGEKAQEIYGKVLPEDTYNAIKEFIVAIINEIPLNAE